MIDTDPETWDISDEATEAFLKHKYQDRKILKEDHTAKKKIAEGQRLLDGKPNPQAPRLRLEADLAETRYEMSLIIHRNQVIERKLDMLEGLFERLALVEGAYSHLRLKSELANIDLLAAKKLYEKMTKGEKP